MKVYLITLLLILLPFILVFIPREHGPVFISRVAMFVVPYTIVLFPLLVYTLFSLFGRLVGLLSHTAGSYAQLVSIVLSVAVFGIMIVGHFWGPSHLTVKEVTVESDKIPAAFDGYKIVQFTDLHLASQASQHEFVEELVQTINAQTADAVCFTGDLVTADRRELVGSDENLDVHHDYRKVLSSLKAKDGVFSVLGNHDYHKYTAITDRLKVEWIEQFKQDERDLGWKLLLNEHVILHRGNDSICIAGSENDGDGKHFPQYGDLNKTFKGAENVVCKILLSHDPTHWERKILPETKQHDVLLTLSGHTHAMQFKVAGWSPTSWIYKQNDGLYEKDSHYINVSHGVGGAGLPFRFGAWPEICVITLKVRS